MRISDWSSDVCPSDLVTSDFGRKLMEREPYLPDLLDDHRWIDELPEGTVGHAYVTFMRREGLSAAGLVAESDKMGRQQFDDQLQWYSNRLRDTHDLFPILTGYGRAALGEPSVQIGQGPCRESVVQSG